MTTTDNARKKAINALMEIAAARQAGLAERPNWLCEHIAWDDQDARDLMNQAWSLVADSDDTTSERTYTDVYAGAASLLHEGWSP